MNPAIVILVVALVGVILLIVDAVRDQIKARREWPKDDEDINEEG